MFFLYVNFYIFMYFHAESSNINHMHFSSVGESDNGTLILVIADVQGERDTDTAVVHVNDTLCDQITHQ